MFVRAVGKVVGHFPKVHQIFIRVRNMSTRHDFTVCVEGNIASGKTNFLEYFKKSSSLVEIHEEPVTKWQNIDGHNALAKMYEDPQKWAMPFQTYVQQTLLEMHLMKQKCPVKVAERSIYSSRYCFVENLHRNKTMADFEYIVLSKWFDWILKSHNIKVDLIGNSCVRISILPSVSLAQLILSFLKGFHGRALRTTHASITDVCFYLRTRPEVVFQRLKDRNRAEEQRITLEYLQALHDLHEEWLIKKSKFPTPCPVLVIDANNSLPEMLKIYEERKSEILFGLKDT